MNLEQGAFVPFIIAIVQLAKMFNMPSRFAPLLAVILGVGLNLSNGIFYVEKVIEGIIIGLSAAGLYSSTKSIIGK